MSSLASFTVSSNPSHTGTVALGYKTHNAVVCRLVSIDARAAIYTASYIVSYVAFSKLSNVVLVARGMLCAHTFSDFL